MCQEEEGGTDPVRSFHQSAVVEGRHHRLPGPGGGDDEVAPDPRLTLGLYRLQDLLLEGEGAEVQYDGGEGCSRGTPFLTRAGSGAGSVLSRSPTPFPAPVLRRQCGPEPFQTTLRLFPGDRGEVGVGPVGLEGRPELTSEVGELVRGDLGGPLEALVQRHPGDVGRTHVGAPEARAAVKEEGLDVETGPVGVVGDPEFGSGKLGQELLGPGVGGTQVRGGGDAENRGAGLARLPRVRGRVGKAAEGIPEGQDPATLDERHEPVHPVGRQELLLKLTLEARRVGRTVQESRESQGEVGARGLLPGHGDDPWGADLPELLEGEVREEGREALEG